MRLITFGCSNTRGDGLPDMPEDITMSENNDAKSSSFVWPALLGNLLKCDEVINYAIGGNSNKNIAQDVLNTKFEKNDIVVIMWTYFTRTCFYISETETLRLIPRDASLRASRTRDEKGFAKHYYRNFYFPYDAYINDWKNIEFVNLYLKNKGIRAYHTNCWEETIKDDHDVDAVFVSVAPSVGAPTGLPVLSRLSSGEASGDPAFGSAIGLPVLSIRPAFGKL